MKITAAAAKRLIAGFRKSKGSNHSGDAETLHLVVGYCERKGWPYTITAYPGYGYQVNIIPPGDVPYGVYNNSNPCWRTLVWAETDYRGENMKVPLNIGGL